MFLVLFKLDFVDTKLGELNQVLVSYQEWTRISGVWIFETSQYDDKMVMMYADYDDDDDDEEEEEDSLTKPPNFTKKTHFFYWL